MKPIRIRRGVTSDAPELAAFAARTFAETFAAENRPEDMQAHLESSYGVPQQTRELTDPDVATLLAHRDGALVAYAQVRRKSPPPCVTQEQPIELHRFYVDRPAQGSGLAKELMSAVQHAAHEFGGRHLWLSVWERNPRAIAFYTKVGFVDVGTADFYVGPDRQTDRVLVAVVPPVRSLSAAVLADEHVGGSKLPFSLGPPKGNTMHSDELKATFDQQAAGYDEQWAKMAPIREALHFLVVSVFAELPADARLLCVGAGTGAELAHLARQFPRWRFTAVDPSGAMLDACRRKAEKEGFASRCHFHEGYLDSLPGPDPYDAATCFLVSQFLLEQEARSAFFGTIAGRLRPGGILASSDLASEVGSDAHERLLRFWLGVMAAADVSPERLARMRAAYANDVAILPPATVASLIASGGFEPPVQFFQAGLIHAWFSKRASAHAAR